MEDSALLERKALGRVAPLGALYDARRDVFCTGTLFRTVDLPEDCKYSMDATYSQLDYTLEDSFINRCQKLEVDADLKLSILSGMAKISGSGKYILDEVTSSRSVKGTMIYNVKTKEEKINIHCDAINKYISRRALETTKATHFVEGIVWGANLFTSFEYSNINKSDKMAVRGQLMVEIEELLGKANLLQDVVNSLKSSDDADKVNEKVESKDTPTKSEVDTPETKKSKVAVNSKKDNFKANVRFCNNISKETIKNFKITVYGDVIPENENIPQDMEAAMNMVNKTPMYLKNVNNGKGKPLIFYLSPLSLVRDHFKITVPAPNCLIQDFSLKSKIVSIEQMFENILKAKQELNDLITDISSNASACIPSEKIRDIEEFGQNLSIAESRFQMEIQKAIVDLRSGNVPKTPIHVILQNFSNSQYSPDGIRKFLATQSLVQLKIQWFKELFEAGIAYKMESDTCKLQTAMLGHSNIYVFIFSNFEESVHTERWQQNSQRLLKIAKSAKRDKWFCVFEETAASSALKAERGDVDYPIIRHYIESRIVSVDVLLDTQNFLTEITSRGFRILLELARLITQTISSLTKKFRHGNHRKQIAYISD